MLILGTATVIPASADGISYFQDFAEFSAGDLSTQLTADSPLVKLNGYSRITSGKILQTKLETADSGIGVNLDENSETAAVVRIDIYPYANMNFAIALSDGICTDKIILNIPSFCVTADGVIFSDDTVLDYGACAVLELYTDFESGEAFLYVNSVLKASNIPVDVKKLTGVSFTWSPGEGYDESDPLYPLMDNIVITSDSKYFPVMQKNYDFQTAVMPEDGYFDYDGICYMYDGRFCTVAGSKQTGGAIIDISNFMRSDEAFFEIEALFDTNSVLSFELDRKEVFIFDSSDMKVYNSSGEYMADFDFGTSSGGVTLDFYTSGTSCEVYANDVFLAGQNLDNIDFDNVGFIWSTASDE